MSARPTQDGRGFTTKRASKDQRCPQMTLHGVLTMTDSGLYSRVCLSPSQFDCSDPTGHETVFCMVQCAHAGRKLNYK